MKGHNFILYLDLKSSRMSEKEGDLEITWPNPLIL